MGNHLAAGWHWIAAGLAVWMCCAWSVHSSLTPTLMFILTVWEATGLFGHYVLRHVGRD